MWDGQTLLPKDRRHLPSRRRAGVQPRVAACLDSNRPWISRSLRKQLKRFTELLTVQIWTKARIVVKAWGLLDALSINYWIGEGGGANEKSRSWWEATPKRAKTMKRWRKKQSVVVQTSRDLNCHFIKTFTIEIQKRMMKWFLQMERGLISCPRRILRKFLVESWPYEFEAELGKFAKPKTQLS